MTPQRGSVLVVGLVLLSLVTLLALSGAGAAHVELTLAHNTWFRENAASAASAGIESAISRIVSATDPHTVPTSLSGTVDASLPGARSSFQVSLRLLGFEAGLPQSAGASLVGAHFDIVSTGRAARGAMDHQRAQVIHVVPAGSPIAESACDPVEPGVHCARAGDWQRLAWQRVAAP